MAERRHIRIFISSPADVNPEREVARRVIARLDREFSYHFRVDGILWEREPLIATEHFQTMIAPPSSADIVLVILWSRLGSFLPPEQFTGKVSGKVPVTGTEWEFEDAVHSYRARGKPDLLLYRKQARISADLDDREELERRLGQKEMLESFLTRWFTDGVSEGLKAACHQFGDAGQLEEMLETHLRALLRQRLNLPEGESLDVDIHWHEGSPFRGLESFDLRHAPIFFGRTRERLALRDALATQAARGSAFLLVFGASGSGKSSLVKAGLLADLRVPGMMDRVGLVRHAILQPSDGADMLMGLAASLLSVDALPELGALQYDTASLAGLLRAAPEQVVLPIRQGLARAGEHAGLINGAQSRLLLVVDQLEELFSIAQTSAEEQQGFVRALKSLAQSGLVWVIATMRSDFFDRLAALPILTELSDGAGRYLLSPPGPAALGQIVRQPAREAGLRFEKDPRSGIGLDEILREAAARDAAALPLLQFTLHELWNARDDRGVLTLAAYHAMGGLEGALGERAEAIFLDLPESVQAGFPSVLRRLVAVGQGERGEATSRRVSKGEFSEGTPERVLIERFVAPDARLLVADGDDAGARIRVAHEALLTHWPRAARQLVADRHDLQLRGRLEESAALWMAASERDRPAFLLQPGLPLSSGEDLLARREQELDTAVCHYIWTSRAAHRRRQAEQEQEQRHRLKKARTVSAVMTGLTLVSMLVGAVAVQQQQRLVQQEELMAQQQEKLEEQGNLISQISQRFSELQRRRLAEEGLIEQGR